MDGDLNGGGIGTDGKRCGTTVVFFRQAMNEETVYNAWNQFRPTRNRAGKWKGCAMLDGFTKSTIRQALRAHGGSERVLAAIANYHEVWCGKEYKWTYAWTLCQFLTRKDRGGIPQIRQFLPGNFRAESYLSDSEKTKRAAKAKAEAAVNKYGIDMQSAPKKPVHNWQKLRDDINAVRN